MIMDFPKVPMAPVNSQIIPVGPEWGYHIKWDGFRNLTHTFDKGDVQLLSKRLEPRNDKFPEIVELFRQLRLGNSLFDSEVAYFDGTRPNFYKLLRLRKNRLPEASLICVIFDMLYDNGEDLRSLPFMERYNRLKAKLADVESSRIFVSDLFYDGQALWDWVKENEWEGIVSKRLDSPYVEGKNHTYWYKRRNELSLTVHVVGIKLKYGQVSSLVLSYDDQYIGHVSGLDNKSKQLIMQFAKEHAGSCPFSALSPGMKKSDVIWLSIPFAAKISALGFTDSGLLRQPKLIGFGV